MRFIVLPLDLFWFQLPLETIFKDFFLFLRTKVEDNRPFFDEEFNATWNKANHNNSFDASMNTTAFDAAMPVMNLSTDLCAYIYAGLAFSTLFICIFRSAIYYYLVLRISQRLHDFMFSSVIAAPMRFFDTNPSGNFPL